MKVLVAIALGLLLMLALRATSSIQVETETSDVAELDMDPLVDPALDLHLPKLLVVDAAGRNVPGVNVSVSTDAWVRPLGATDHSGRLLSQRVHIQSVASSGLRWVVRESQLGELTIPVDLELSEQVLCYPGGASVALQVVQSRDSPPIASAILESSEFDHLVPLAWSPVAPVEDKATAANVVVRPYFAHGLLPGGYVLTVLDSEGTTSMPVTIPNNFDECVVTLNLSTPLNRTPIDARTICVELWLAGVPMADTAVGVRVLPTHELRNRRFRFRGTRTTDNAGRLCFSSDRLVPGMTQLVLEVPGCERVVVDGERLQLSDLGTIHLEFISGRVRLVTESHFPVSGAAVTFLSTLSQDRSSDDGWLSVRAGESQLRVALCGQPAEEGKILDLASANSDHELVVPGSDSCVRLLRHPSDQDSSASHASLISRDSQGTLSMKHFALPSAWRSCSVYAPPASDSALVISQVEKGNLTARAVIALDASAKTSVVVEDNLSWIEDPGVGESSPLRWTRIGAVSLPSCQADSRELQQVLARFVRQDSNRRFIASSPSVQHHICHVDGVHTNGTTPIRFVLVGQSENQVKRLARVGCIHVTWPGGEDFAPVSESGHVCAHAGAGELRLEIKLRVGTGEIIPLGSFESSHVPLEIVIQKKLEASPFEW